MEKILLASGLNGFVLLDEIMEACPEGIKGRKCFARAPVAFAIEALAQLGAMHVRFMSQFERHAFLLAVKHCEMKSGEPLDGEYYLHGVQAGHSRGASSYMLRAVQGCETRIEGNFLFASIEYDEVFTADIIKNHYRKVFSCLWSGSGRNS